MPGVDALFTQTICDGGGADSADSCGVVVCQINPFNTISVFAQDRIAFLVIVPGCEALAAAVSQAGQMRGEVDVVVVINALGTVGIAYLG